MNHTLTPFGVLWKRSSILVSVGLVLLFLLLRLGRVWMGSIPFMLDHARDALVVLEMINSKSPTLIGPAASIQGLFFGPLWYYLLLPVYLIHYDPIISLLPVLLIGTITFCLMWRYYGIIAAVIVATTTTWIWTTTSAWNPFPLTLSSLAYLLLLSWIVNTKNYSNKLTFFAYCLLGLAISSGFHFSSAYAIFYLPIMVVVVLLYRVRPTLLQMLGFVSALCALFVPQFAFELRNDWLQTRSVLRYFSSGESPSPSVESMLDLAKGIWGYLISGTLPDVSWLPAVVENVILGVLLVVLITITWKKKRSFRKYPHLIISSLMILIPIVSYIFLHFSPWYILGMLPAMTVIIAWTWSWLSQRYLTTIVGMYVLFSLLSFGNQMTIHIKDESLKFFTLHPKKEALLFVKDQAKNSPYASYHYVSDVYDYSYQYLYLTGGLKGDTIPVEFAYAPNVPAYVTGKDLALAEISRRHPKTVTNESAQLIFFIIEKPEYPELLVNWWQNQIPIDVLGERTIVDGLTVIWGTPQSPVVENEHE